MTNSRGKLCSSLSSIFPSQPQPWPFIENPVQDSIHVTSLTQSIVTIFVKSVIFMGISSGIAPVTFATAARPMAATNLKTVNALAAVSTE